MRVGARGGCELLQPERGGAAAPAGRGRARSGRSGAFTIKKVGEGCEADWRTLAEGEVMRGFVDESTMMWVLKKKLGDRIIYQDEWGREFPVEMAGTLKDTVFQGQRGGG